MMNRFIAYNMPKIELHCHLDGSMSVELTKKLLSDMGEEYTKEELQEALTAPMDCPSLADYLKRFDLPLRCLQTKEGLFAAAEELALRRVNWIGTAAVQKLFERKLGAVELRVNAVVCGDQGMYLTEHADALIACPNGRAAAGVVGGIIGAGLEAYILRAKVFYNSLDETLDGEEIDLRTVGAEGEILLLDGKSVLAAEVIGSAELVELNLLVAEVVVAGEYFEHGRQSGRAHDGGVLAQRVEDLEACALRGVCRHADLVVIGGG